MVVPRGTSDAKLVKGESCPDLTKQSGIFVFWRFGLDSMFGHQSGKFPCDCFLDPGANMGVGGRERPCRSWSGKVAKGPAVPSIAKPEGGDGPAMGCDLAFSGLPFEG